MKQEIALWSIVLFALFLISCWAGDDDVVYKFFDRKPTPAEGLIRIRFVLIKTLASLFGGAALSIYINEFFLKGLLSFSKNEAALFIVFWIGIFSLMLSVFQNWIRIFQNRPQRPLIDRKIWRKNLRQWAGKRN